MSQCRVLNDILLFSLSLLCIAAICRHSVKANYNFSLDMGRSKSLICYQCNSTSNEAIPSCQIGYFRFNKPWQKLMYRFQCPYHMADYCFLIEENFGGEKRTSRGCYGRNDKNAREVKTGCSVEENRTMCFCERMLCNSSKLLNSYFLSYLQFVIYFFI